MVSKSTLLFILFIFSLGLSQNVVFKDVQFKSLLVNDAQINTDGNAEISIIEAQAVDSIIIPPHRIVDVTGIAAFKQLKKLDVHYNHLTALDISHNTALQYLNCDGNGIGSLDLTQNTALKTLICTEAKLTSLDLYHNKSLEVLYCGNNPLGTLDVSNNTLIKELRCFSAQLTQLNVKENPLLTSLWCSGNLLTALDLRANENLQELNCNVNNLQNLNISTLGALISLDCSGNKLSGIDITKNVALQTLRCSNNMIGALDLTNNHLLELLWCNENQLLGLDLSRNPLIDNLDCSYNHLSQLDVRNLNLSYLVCYFNPELKRICVRNMSDVYRGYFAKSHEAQWSTCDSRENNVCMVHVSNTALCEDFEDADPNTNAIEEYTVATNKVRWEQGAPNPDEKAYMGLFWTDEVDRDGFTAKKSRFGNQILAYHITQKDSMYEPFFLVFGSYAEAGLEKKFTIDLTGDKTVSFDLKNGGDGQISFYTQLEDIHGNSLMFDNNALSQVVGDQTYKYQIGFADDSFYPHWSTNDYSYAEGKSNFSFDFANAICGITESVMIDGSQVKRNVPKPQIAFDYAQVALVKFFVSGYINEVQHGDLIDYPIEISNFRMGQVSPVTILPNQLNPTNSDELFEVYDLMGNFIKKGNEQELVLPGGRLYILKSASKVKKKVVID
ncbi:MAG TPA: hypothetical protein VL947_04300 [Cytophagales bacterium]|nr:hypothetical protein [Cytophagales bacterium]